MSYRIGETPGGDYAVFATPPGFCPIGDTYPNREAAQDAADWINSLPEEERAA